MLGKAWASLQSGWRWLRRYSRLRQDLDELRATVQQLATDVEQLKGTAPPRPTGVVLKYGIYWGRAAESSEVAPYCPSCAPDGKYVPLTRDDRWSDGSRRDDEIFFTCPTCKWERSLVPDEEREALLAVADALPGTAESSR